MLVVFLATALCSGAGAEELYHFSGSIDVPGQAIKLIVGEENHHLSLNVSRQNDQLLVLNADFEHFPTPLFDMTTQLKGVVRLENLMFKPKAVSGRIWQDGPGSDRFDDQAFNLEFRWEEDMLHIRKLVLEGMSGAASMRMFAPFTVDVRLAFQEMDIAYIMAWLKDGTRKLEAQGTVSGYLHLSGTPDHLTVKSNIVSQNGSIEKLSYELFSLHLQGVYPMIELAHSTITKSSGLSFDLEGTVDLSNRTNIKSQFKAIKKIPLIKENALQSQWVFKRVQDPDGEGRTETKFFIRKDKRTSSTDPDDSELFGMEKKIGF